MSKEHKVKFTKDWKFSPNGYSVVTYTKDQETDLCERGYELAKKEGVIQSPDKKKAKNKSAKTDDNASESGAAPSTQDKSAKEDAQDNNGAPDTGADLLTET